MGLDHWVYRSGFAAEQPAVCKDKAYSKNQVQRLRCSRHAK